MDNANEITDLLLRPAPPYCIPAFQLDADEFDELAEAVREQKVAFRILDADRPVESKAMLLDVLARVLRFPAGFGHNWDALEDYLADLSWLDDKGWVLAFTQGLPDSDDMRVFQAILANAAEVHAKAGRPLKILVIALGQGLQPVSVLLEQLRSSNDTVAAAALDSLLARLQPDLHSRAAKLMKDFQRIRTFGPTALVNELYLKMVKTNVRNITSIEVFIYFSVKLMRQTLLDYVKRKDTGKRGKDVTTVSLADVTAAAAGTRDSLFDFDPAEVGRAIDELGRRDEWYETLIDLRFFWGLQYPEIAHKTGKSEATIRRHLRLAREELRSILEGA